MTMHRGKRFRRGAGDKLTLVTRKGSFKSVSNAKDFEAVLALPARLVGILRALFGVTPKMWSFALDKLRQGTAYHIYYKSKGPGRKPRKICAPCNELKLLQERILHRFLREIPVHYTRESNRSGTSILTNAEKHAGAKAVFSLDLVDAFPNTWRSRVRTVIKGHFFETLRKQFLGEEFSDANLVQLLESTLDLVMLQDRLPQGPPSSPRILDLCLFSADAQLQQLVRESSKGLQTYTLTGYADDYTLSSDEEIPESIRQAVVEILTTLGWPVHTREDKTKYMSPAMGEVPIVTGLVLCPDGRITMAPRKVNEIRARLYQLLKLPEWDANKRGEAAGLRGFVQNVYGDKPPSDLRAYMTQTEARLTHPIVPYTVPEDPCPTTSPETIGVVKKKGRKGKKSPDLA